LIAVDEEGGTIERLGERYGFRHTPSAAEVGRNSEEGARVEYQGLAQKLSDVGFNMNLAPVVDLNTNPTNPIIGSLDRSFSSDPISVSRYAKIFIEEHHKKGVLTALKHFPRHGSASTDSHVAIADVQLSWSSEELIPYQNLIGARLVDSIMVGHLANAPNYCVVILTNIYRGKQHDGKSVHKFPKILLACPIHQDNANFEVWRNFPSPAATIRGAACSARFDFIFIG